MNMYCCIFILSLVSIFTSTSMADDIYKCKVDGKVKYSDKKCGVKLDFKPLNIAAHSKRISFTSWMSYESLDDYFNSLNNHDPDSNYFSKGNWLIAVDGRWNGENAEYRVSLAKKPKEAFWWWWVNQTEVLFDKKIKEYQDKGAKLVYTQSFLMPDGTKRYQGVWHKLK